MCLEGAVWPARVGACAKMPEDMYRYIYPIPPRLVGAILDLNPTRAVSEPQTQRDSSRRHVSRLSSLVSRISSLESRERARERERALVVRELSGSQIVCSLFAHEPRDSRSGNSRHERLSVRIGGSLFPKNTVWQRFEFGAGMGPHGRRELQMHVPARRFRSSLVPER